MALGELSEPRMQGASAIDTILPTPSAASIGIKLLEVCPSIHKRCFMPDSSFVVNFVLMKIMIKAAK